MVVYQYKSAIFLKGKTQLEDKKVFQRFWSQPVGKWCLDEVPAGLSESGEMRHDDLHVLGGGNFWFLI